MAQEYGYDDDEYNDYSGQENKYECRTGPFEGFFVSSPEFCKSKVIPDRDRDGNKTPPSSNPDRDGDGVNNDVDNCPDVANPDQADSDNDGIGNVCDPNPSSPDTDRDGINDDVDNCPDVANPDQADQDGDRIGNVCDPDDDNDGINDNVDNCPLVANTNQTDSDNDRIGDVCDPTPTPPSNLGVEPLAFSDLGQETGNITSGWEWGKSQAADITPPSNNLQTVGKSSETPLSPDPQGDRILKATVFPGDLALDSESTSTVSSDTTVSRAEVVHNEPFQRGIEDLYYEDDDADTDADNVDDEMWFHWYTLFPSESVLPITNKSHVWTQFHQVPNQATCPTPTGNIPCSAVPILFNLVDINDTPDKGPLLQFLIIDKNRIASNTNFFETVWTDPEPLQRGEWYEFLLHV